MNRYLQIVGFFIMSAFHVKAQDDTNKPLQALLDKGFENVCVDCVDDTAFVMIDVSMYRGTFRGPAVAIKTIEESMGDGVKVNMLVSEYGNPRVNVFAEKIDGMWNLEVGYDGKDVMKRFSACKGVKNNYGKIDVNLIPIVSLDNHTYDKLFEVGLFFAPSVETSLWKGNRVIVQPIIPLYNNFVSTDSHRNVRLGVAAISQDLFSTGRLKASIHAGAFYQDVVGLFGKVDYRFNSRLDIGAHIGYSYTSIFYDKKWYIGRPSMLNMMVSASYYDPCSSLHFQAQYGRFMYGDWGGRFDVTKHFGEYAVGAYGILTGGEHNGGFHFAIPFGGKSQIRNGIIRVRLPQYYDLQYSMVSYWEYVWEKMGREFEEIPDKNQSAHFWQAAYIKRYMQKCLNGNFE